MKVPFFKRTMVLALLVAGLACAGNNESNDTGRAVLDTTDATISDSARANQTESGVTDSSGQSTLGSGVEQTSPDQGQPVTAKGDTVSTGVDSSTIPGVDSSTVDSSTTPQ
jgi:hypothetical protein